MKCPACSTEMVEGEAALQGTFWGALFVGMSYQKLFFRPAGTRKWTDSALASGDRAIAYRCPDCAGIFIQQPPSVAGDE